MRDYRDLRRVYNLTLTQAFFALLEQKVLDVWETLARMGYGKKDWFDFTEKRWKALPVDRQITYASQYQRWYAERLGVGMEQSFEGSVFRLIPPGKFTIGSPASEVNRYGDEKQKKVFIREAYWVGRYLVTQEEYEKVIKMNPSLYMNTNHPVTRINWYMAEEYSLITGTQLLSESEWEYACRAGTTTAYSFGNDPDLLKEYAWYDENSEEETHPVGEKKANAWGLQDMLGNVWEWCDIPRGSLGDNYKMIRGGSCLNSVFTCRPAYRYRSPSSRVGNYQGFRVRKFCVVDFF